MPARSLGSAVAALLLVQACILIGPVRVSEGTILVNLTKSHGITVNDVMGTAAVVLAVLLLHEVWWAGRTLR